MADEKTKSDKDDKPKTKKSSGTKKSAASTKKASPAKKSAGTAKKGSSKAKAPKKEETVDAPAEEKPKRQRRRKPREAADTPEPKTNAKTDSKAKADSKSKPKADAKSKPKADAKSKPKADAKSKPKADAKSKPKTDSKSKSKDSKKDDKKSKRPERDLPKTPAKLRDAAVKMLAGLFERMELDIQAKPQKLNGQTVNIDLTGPDADTLLGLNQSSPRVLEAVQTLSRQMLTDGRSMKLVLDVGGFRSKRTKRLEDVAGKLAEVAAKAGQPVVVAGFNSFERKVVHQALEDTKSVKTESEGYGSFRKLRLEPN